VTLHDIRLLHAFNSWASSRIFDSLTTLPSEMYLRDMKSSHGSIHGTLTHMVGAEKIWLSRWMGTPGAKMLQPSEVAGLLQLKGIWESVGYETAKFLGTMTDKKLQETLTFTNVKGETLTVAYWQSLQHVVDHSTYHRGQVITLMRQFGVTPPSTGLIGFYRETNKLK
jgi:uncharacterized damage-inducible protein DinB